MFLTDIQSFTSMSIPQEALKCKEWNGDERFPDGELDKYTIEGVEAIHNDLLTYGGWNGTKPVATIVLGVGDDRSVTSTILHLLGESPEKVIEAKHLWPSSKPDHHVKVKTFDLAKITFRGSLASEYSYNFNWVYRIPSKSKPGHYHEVDPTERGLSKLALRVLAQPWLNGTIKISAGVIPHDDITQLSNSADFRCPLVEVFSITLPLLPRPECDVPIPSCPYFLDSRTDTSGRLVVPDQTVVFNNISAFFKNQTRPNMKKSSWEKAKLEDWGTGEPCRYTTEDKVTEDADVSDDDNLGGKEDNDADNAYEAAETMGLAAKLCLDDA